MISVAPVSRVACTHRTWRHHADFSRGPFYRADLSGANLFEVDRTIAKFAGAKLRGVVEKEPPNEDPDDSP